MLRIRNTSISDVEIKFHVSYQHVDKSILQHPPLFIPFDFFLVLKDLIYHFPNYFFSVLLSLLGSSSQESVRTRE